MATQLQIRRGTSSQVAAFTGAEGEVVVNTTNDSIHVNDGSTAGGFELARVDGSNWAITNAISTTANISFGDNDKAIFGAGSDLEIYHDGSNSYVKEKGNGVLNISGGNAINFLTGNDAAETGLTIATDGAVTAYYNNSAKLATTNTGIDVTGTVTATAGAFESTGATEITLEDTDGGFAASKINVQNGGRDLKVTAPQDMIFNVGSSDAVTILNGGNVGIGTSSPSKKLSIKADGGGSQLGIDIHNEGTATGDDAVISFETQGSREFTMGLDRSATSFVIAESSTLGSNQRLVIDDSGNVGIGTSPEKRLHIFDGTQTNQTIRFGNPSATALADINYSSIGVEHLYISVKGTTTGYGNIVFSTGPTPDEAARIDSSGRLLVGQTSADNNENGVRLSKVGTSWFTATSDYPMGLNRKTSDGTILWFGKDASNVGSIGTLSGDLNIGSGDTGLDFSAGLDAIMPYNPSTNGLRDDTIDLGQSSARFDDIYATNGTIQTSDRNEKQDIEALSDAEQRVAVAAKGLLRKFRWISSVEENGDDARIHFGIIAQDLQAAFEAEGLDAGRYGMFINTTWTDEDTGEERSRMGVRYSELLAFIIAAI